MSRFAFAFPSFARMPGGAALLTAVVVAVAAMAPFALPRSSQQVEAVPTTALLGAIAAWTAESSGLPLPATMPSIVLASRGEMATLHYGEGGDAARRAIAVEALYEEGTGRIYLADDWTGATPEELSVLVHEMTHHLQAAAGIRHACPAEREALAYDVQARWLETFGTDLEAAFGINRMTRFVFTRCGI